MSIKRLIKEVKDRCDEVNGKRAMKFEAEVSKWVAGVLGRIEVGSSLFYDYVKVALLLNNPSYEFIGMQGASTHNEKPDVPFPSSVATELERLSDWNSNEAMDSAEAEKVQELFTYLVKYMNYQG